MYSEEHIKTNRDSNKFKGKRYETKTNTLKNYQPSYQDIHDLVKTTTFYTSSYNDNAIEEIKGMWINVNVKIMIKIQIKRLN